MTDALPFTEQERRTLTALAGLIVPASEEFGVPGADDPAVVEGILTDASRRPEQLSAALAALDASAQESSGAAFADLDDAARQTAVDAFRDAHKGHANLAANLTVAAYYRDDRVMRSLGMETRPPHPQGYEVEQGDWSLLDPVKGKTPFYRSAT